MIRRPLCGADATVTLARGTLDAVILKVVEPKPTTR